MPVKNIFTICFSVMSHLGRSMVKPESHLSVGAPRRAPASVIRTDYLSQDEEPVPPFMYPHLQVKYTLNISQIYFKYIYFPDMRSWALAQFFNLLLQIQSTPPA